MCVRVCYSVQVYHWHLGLSVSLHNCPHVHLMFNVLYYLIAVCQDDNIFSAQRSSYQLLIMVLRSAQVLMTMIIMHHTKSG